MPKAGDNKLYITHTPHRLHVSLSSSSSALPTHSTTTNTTHNSTPHHRPSTYKESLRVLSSASVLIVRTNWRAPEATLLMPYTLEACVQVNIWYHIVYGFSRSPTTPSSLLYMYQLYILWHFVFIYISRYMCIISLIASSNTHIESHSRMYILK